MGDDDVAGAPAEATKSAAQAERNGEGKLGAAAGGGPEASAEEEEGAGAVPPQLQLRSAIDAAAAHTRAEGEKKMEHGQPQAGEDGEARAEQPPPSPPPSPKTDEPPPKQTADQILASLGITAQATGEGGRGGVNAAATDDADSRDSWDDAAERVLEAQAMEMEEAKKEPSPVGVPAHAMEADKAVAVEIVAAESAVAAHLAELRRRQDEGEGLRAEELEELRQGEAAVVSGADADEASRLQTTVRRGLSRLAGVGRVRSRSPLKAAAGTPEPAPAPAPESVAGSTAARAIARAKTEKQITAVGAAAAGAATSDEPLSPPPLPDHIQLTQLDLRGTRIAQANLPHTIGHLSWEDRGGRVLTAHGSESRRWESDSRECDAFMQTVVETRVGDVGRRAFQPPRYYSRVAAKRRGDDGGKDPIEKNNNGEDDDDDDDDDTFAPPAEPHYSTQVCESYATPLEAHYEIFAEGVYERGASGRRWETDAETESFMARMARKAGDSGPPPFVPEGGMGMEPSSKGTSRRWATIRGSVGAFTVLRGRITSKRQQDEL